MFKGVGMPWVKRIILIVSDRVAQDELFGVDDFPKAIFRKLNRV